MTTPATTSKTPTTDGKGKAPQPDVMPEPIDDAADGDVEAAGGEAPETAHDGTPAEGKEPVRPQLFEDEGRASAVRKYREIRDREMAEAKAAEQGKTADQQPEGASEGEANQDDPARSQAAADAPPAQAAQTTQTQPVEGQEPPAKHKIVVNGREEFLPLDEVIRRAQLSTATIDKLDEAKQVLAEVKAMRSQPAHQPAAATPAQQTDPSQDQPDAGNQRVKGLDPDKLKGIVERIQVGDSDEGAEALSQLVELVKGDGSKPSVDADQVGRIVQQHLVKTQTEGDMVTALERFKAKYPAIAADPDLGEAGATILRRNIIADLKSAGVSEEAIAPIRNDTAMLAHAIAGVKRTGHNVRSFDTLLNDTGETMRTKFGIATVTAEATPATAQPETKPSQQSPQPAQRTQIGTPSEIQARIDKKRAMPSQPRPAGVRGAMPQPPKPKTAQEIVADIRKARGFPAH